MQTFRPEETPMTPEEAQAVVRRHLEAIPPGATGPNVADVAEALGVPPEEVARLLDEVRQNPKPLNERVKFPLWSIPAGIVGGLALLMILRAMMPPSVPITINTPPPVATQSATEDFSITMEGVGERTTEATPATADALMSVLNDMSRPMSATAASGPSLGATPDEAARCLKNIAAGAWSGPGITEREVVVRRFGPSGKFVRWIRAKLPFYDADDPKVDEACFKERQRRLEEAIRTQG